MRLVDEAEDEGELEDAFEPTDEADECGEVVRAVDRADSLALADVEAYGRGEVDDDSGREDETEVEEECE